MKTKLLHEADGKRTFAVVLQTDDEAMGCLRAFAVAARLRLSPRGLASFEVASGEVQESETDEVFA